MVSPIKIFCCYARKDQALLKRLKTHLISLQRQGLITTWADTDISPGEDWESEINKYINSAQIILLLISPDFMASNYCYSKEMTQALDRHKQGSTCVIPIILRPTYFQGTPFEKLQMLPKDAKPLKKWSNIDDGFLSIIEGIQLAIAHLPQPNSQSAGQPILSSPQTPSLNAISHSISKQPAGQLILPNTQISPLPLNTIPQSMTNQPPAQPTPRTYRVPLLNTSSLQTPNQPATPLTPTNTQTPPLNTSSHTTNNQPLTQSPPITQSRTIKSPSNHSLIFKIFKIALYFIGAFIAEFAFLGGAITSTDKDQTLSSRVGGIAFFIGIIALLVSTIIFFRKHYYRYHMRGSRYMGLLTITSTVMIALLILSLSVIPGKSTDPVNSALISSVFFLYGISLVIITYLKP